MNNSIYNQLTANLELLKLSQMKLHLDEIRDFVTNNERTCKPWFS